MKFYTMYSSLNDVFTPEIYIKDRCISKPNYLTKKENNDSYIFTYALTGTEKEDISVELTNEWIKVTYTYEGKTKSISDYVGNYKFNRDNSTCKYRNGLLTISLAKTIDSKPTSLNIEE